MQLSEGRLYHIYNRGINKQVLFSSPANYIYFLTKVRTYLLPVCDIIAYSLLPRHFHFLIHANATSILTTKAGALDMQYVSAAYKHLLSSYTKAYNKMYSRTGSLFVQNTQCKDVSPEPECSNHALACFQYIHQASRLTGVAINIGNWEYSSFRDYAGLRNGTLCNKAKGYQLLQIEQADIEKGISVPIDEENISKLFNSDNFRSATL